MYFRSNCMTRGCVSLRRNKQLQKIDNRLFVFAFQVDVFDLIAYHDS